MAKRKHIAVVGLGQFGAELARTLSPEAEVLAIDIDQARVDELAEDVQRAVCLDARDPQALRAVVSAEFDEAVVSMGGNMEASILATLHLKDIGIPVLRAKALSETHGTILGLVGAGEVIQPERETARRMAARIIDPNLLDFVPLEGDYLVRDVILPPACHGHTLAELDLRSCFDVLIVAVRRTREPHFVFLPGPDYVPEPGDVMVTIGREQDMVALEKVKDFPVCPIRPKASTGTAEKTGATAR